MPEVNVREMSRLQRGWTLDELAWRCQLEGVPTSKSNLWRIERGEQVPRPGLRIVLAKLLDIDVTDFQRQAS